MALQRACRLAQLPSSPGYYWIDFMNFDSNDRKRKSTLMKQVCGLKTCLCNELDGS